MILWIYWDGINAKYSLSANWFPEVFRENTTSHQ